MNQYLLKQIELYPELESQDIVKLCYQASFGAEHILTNLQRAKNYLIEEFNATKAMNINLSEPISDEFSRVNIAGWKSENRSAEQLYDIFIQSVEERRVSVDFDLLMQEYKATLKAVWTEEKLHNLEAFVDNYYRQGIAPVHHSVRYRNLYNPHYRVVATAKL